MGLDLGLKKVILVDASELLDAAEKYESTERKSHHMSVKQLAKEMSTVIEKDFYSAKVTVDVAYWRKANQIFEWFNEHASMKGEDDTDFDVTEDEIIALYKLCKYLSETLKLVEGKVIVERKIGRNGKEEVTYGVGEVLDEASQKIAQEMLPTQAGFFFGSTEYDKWYLEDVKSTVAQLEPIVKDIEARREKGGDDWNIYYHFWASY